MLNSLDVSGTLKTKVTNFFREEISGFNIDSFCTMPFIKGKVNYDNMMFSYFGELYSNNNEKVLLKLKEKQELYIQKVIANIYNLLKLKSYNSYIVISTIERINSTNRTMSVALIETFYQMLLNIKSYQELVYHNQRFNYFLDFLDIKDEWLNGSDLKIYCDLFLALKEPTIGNKKQYEYDNYHIVRDDLDSSVLNVLALGENIDSKRISPIAYNLQNNPNDSSLVLPIYFMLKSDELANTWLRLNRGEIDTETVKNNARRMRIPENMIETIGKRYK